MGGNKGSAREALGDHVLNLELTLISVIQATIFFFLIEGAKDPIVRLEFATWPTILVGLTITISFWARAMIHTLTVISWPLDFAHNFLYLACTVVQSIMLAELAQPLHWYVAGSAYLALVWLTFLLDRRMIVAQADAGPKTRELFDLLGKEQDLNIRLLIPTGVVFNCGVSIWLSLGPVPELWLVGLALLQLVYTGSYLLYSTLFFQRRVAPLLLASRAESAGD